MSELELDQGCFGGFRFHSLSMAGADWWISASLPATFGGMLLVHVFGWIGSPAVTASLIILWCTGIAVQALMGWLYVRMVSTTRRSGSGMSDLRSGSMQNGISGPLRATVSIAGIWISPQPSKNLTGVAIVRLWLMLLVAMMLLALGAQGMDALTTVERGSGADQRSWWIMPSLGNEPVDRPWLAAAWMVSLQAIWQWLPLPQSFGRVGWTVIAAMFTTSKTPGASNSAILTVEAVAGRTIRSTRWTGIIMAVGGLAAINTAPTPGMALILLSVWLLASTRSSDLHFLARSCDDGITMGRWASKLSIHQWRQRRDNLRQQRQQTDAVRAAHQREQAEAAESTRRSMDAEQAEIVLTKLHASGMQSLTESERELLRRVSESVRRNRQTDSDP
ncbi:MAG: hypothetical protein AAF670_03475 [Planctomycetota bacterium]